MKKLMKRGFMAKLLALALSAIVLLGMFPVGALAAETGSLTVKLKEDTYANLPKDRAVQVTLYQIGAAAPETKAGWKIDGAFSGYGVLNAETTSELGSIAAQIARDIAGKSGYSGAVKTLSQGRAQFTGLDMGVYLGVLTDGPEGLEVDPFIVTVPSRDPETKALRYSYDVILKDQCVTSATVRKVWNDASNQDGLRPASLRVILSNGTANVGAVTLNAENEWQGTISNLPRYSAGNEIAYTWIEESLPAGYTLTSSQTQATVTTLTNSHAPELISATVRKIWNDADNQDGARPTSLTVRLSNGQSVTLNEGNSWTATLDNLPRYSDGEEIAYTWTEVKVDGYTAAAAVRDGQVTTLTNVHQPETTSATVRKVWDDEDNADGIRPASLTVTLSNGQSVTLNADNGWTATIDNLPKYSGGREIAYTWTEAAVSGYEATQAIDGDVTTLTNVHTVVRSTPTPVVTEAPAPTPTLEPETTPTPDQPTPTPTPTPLPTTQVTGEKIWEDDDNAHKTRPESITVQLYADGALLNATPTWRGTRSNTWTYTFSNLPAVTAGGATIRYTVRETPVDNYTSTVSGTTITNRLIPRQPSEYKQITGVKTWVDGENAGGTRPNYITVHLLRNGEEVATRTVTAANDWSYDFGMQPVDDGYGNLYEYEVREDGVPGYFSRVDGMNLINTTLSRTPGMPDTPDNPRRPGNPNSPYAPTGRWPVENRKSGTPRPAFERFGEQELEELTELFGYGTPLWGGLLGTGDETPIYPYIFAGVGAVAVILLLVFGRKRKKGTK